MHKLRALLAVVMLLGFAVGCEQETPKKVPEQKSDLGAPASPDAAAPPAKAPATPPPK